MLEATCHCGRIAIAAEGLPEDEPLTICNCSVCHRYGTLWAYYDQHKPMYLRGRGETVGYTRAGGDLAFHHCPDCGCITHWQGLAATVDRFGLNARLFPREAIAGARVVMLDGAESWTFVGERVAGPFG